MARLTAPEAHVVAASCVHPPWRRRCASIIVALVRRRWRRLDNGLTNLLLCFCFCFCRFFVRHRLDICVGPVLSANKLHVLTRHPKAAGNAVDQCHKVVAVLPAKQGPRPLASGEGAHWAIKMERITLHLRCEVVRSVSPSNPCPVPLVASDREAMPRAECRTRDTAAFAWRVELGGSPGAVGQGVPVTSVAVGDDVEPREPIEVDEGVLPADRTLSDKLTRSVCVCVCGERTCMPRCGCLA